LSKITFAPQKIASSYTYCVASQHDLHPGANNKRRAQFFLNECFLKVFYETETVSQIFPRVSQNAVETCFATTIEIH